ncbi:MAG TPA: hypothetical protein VNL91_03890 [Thermoanaerobaculia bacterium]|nr:hypothetical protein [Thermoanaerobaculia bacterium]
MRDAQFGITAAGVLALTFERGDETSIAHALQTHRQFVSEWLRGLRPNPLGQVLALWKQLRTNGNRRADEPIKWLCAEGGGVFLRLDAIASPTSEQLASLCHEFGDVVRRHGQNLTDGVETIEEKRALLAEVRDLAAAVVAYQRHIEAEIESAEKRKGPQRAQPRERADVRKAVAS